MKKIFIITLITILSTSVYSKAPERTLKSAVEIAYKLMFGQSKEVPSYREALANGLIKRKEEIAILKSDLKVNNLEKQVRLRARLEVEIDKKEKELEDFISVIEGFDPQILEEVE